MLGAAGLLDGLVEVLPELEVLKAALPPRAGPQETSSVEAWVPRIRPLLTRHAGPRAIYDCLRSTDPDFKGSLSAVKRLCLRLGRELGAQPDDVAIPVDTDAGETAQVDFGYVGLVFDAVTQTRRKGWVFVMVLGHSRHQLAKVVFDQRAETWQQLHVEAFTFFGGVPKSIVPDNLKAAVTVPYAAVREVLFITAPKLFHELQSGRGDGSYDKRLARFGTVGVLIIEDLGLLPLRGDEPSGLPGWRAQMPATTGPFGARSPPLSLSQPGQRA
ncbi:MAG: DDE-type integrase/transposase/recombinase [Pseudomonadota bacterium]|nr:DDE-type integrase/transposase/recombinase [Pseudomonadota bacterium]